MYSEILSLIFNILTPPLQFHIADINTYRYIEDRSDGKTQTFCHKAHDEGNEREEEESIPFSWQSIHEVDQCEKDHA